MKIYYYYDLLSYYYNVSNKIFINVRSTYAFIDLILNICSLFSYPFPKSSAIWPIV